MKAIRRIVLEEAVMGAAFLVVTWYVFYVVAIWGFQDYFVEGGFLDYVTGPGIHVEILVSGLGFGCIFAVANHLSEVPAFRQRSLGQIVLLKTGFYLAGLVAVVVLLHGIFLLFIFSVEEIRDLWTVTSPRIMASIALWLALNLLALTFLLEVRRKIGPGNMLALVTGRYHRPREEARVFLFLDLRGSTAIAEELGHVKYSQFIRHCFQDLTEFVFQFRAQVYQFVGDEVVLTWPGKDPQAERRSLAMFFAFKERLGQRKVWYEERFGVVPEFRGGMEEGLVTAAEVGDIKREVAFHGDALNTAARLLELCRDFESPILVSGRVHDVIAREKSWSTRLQGEITLRGKREPVAVYGVEVAG
jgi:adenylate cyclase